MKLIDILVRELPKRGGWPIDSDDERTLTATLPSISWGLDGGGYYAFRGPCDSVSHQLYEETLLARKSGWNGDGLPPVGVVCEGHFPRFPGNAFEWQECLVLYVFDSECAVKSKGTSTLHYCDDFRPIRSEAEKKRDESVNALIEFDLRRKTASIQDLYPELYDAIAAGKIPHIRID